MGLKQIKVSDNLIRKGDFDSLCALKPAINALSPELISKINSVSSQDLL